MKTWFDKAYGPREKTRKYVAKRKHWAKYHKSFGMTSPIIAGVTVHPRNGGTK